MLKEAGEGERGREGGKAGGGGSIRLPPNLELTEVAERVVMEEGMHLPLSLPPSLPRTKMFSIEDDHSFPPSPSLPPSLPPSGASKDVGAFLCFMVEAARRLNCLDDLER